MIDQNFFQIAVSIASALGGWWMKAMWDAIKDLKEADERLARSVNDLRVLVAGDYASNEKLELLSSALFTKLDRIEDKLDRKVDKP